MKQIIILNVLNFCSFIEMDMLYIVMFLYIGIIFTAQFSKNTCTPHPHAVACKFLQLSSKINVWQQCITSCSYRPKNYPKVWTKNLHYMAVLSLVDARGQTGSNWQEDYSNSNNHSFSRGEQKSISECTICQTLRSYIWSHFPPFWSSWPLSAWCYGLHCWHVMVRLNNCMNKQAYRCSY